MASDWSLIPPKALRTTFTYFSINELSQFKCVSKSWYKQIKFFENIDLKKYDGIEFDFILIDEAKQLKKLEDAKKYEEAKKKEEEIKEEVIEKVKEVVVEKMEEEPENTEDFRSDEDDSEDGFEERNFNPNFRRPNYGDLFIRHGSSWVRKVKEKGHGYNGLIGSLSKKIPKQEWCTDEIADLMMQSKESLRMSKDHDISHYQKKRLLLLKKITNKKLKNMKRDSKRDALIRLGFIKIVRPGEPSCNF